MNKKTQKEQLTPREALMRSIVIDQCKRLVARAVELGATKAQIFELLKKDEQKRAQEQGESDHEN